LNIITGPKTRKKFYRKSMCINGSYAKQKLILIYSNANSNAKQNQIIGHIFVAKCRFSRFPPYLCSEQKVWA
jgi:hypothetical protein